MRVVYFLPDVEGGVARVVQNLLEFRPETTGINYAVVLFSTHEKSSSKNELCFKADEVDHFNYGANENPWAVFKRMSKLLKSPEDVVVSNDGYAVKMVAALKLRNPVVYIMHGDFDYYYSIVKQYHAVINSCIAISETIQTKLLALWPQGHKKIKLAYFPSAAVQLQNKHLVKGTNFTVLFVGALNERKGADLLPAIIEGVHKESSEVAFEIIGDGPLRPVAEKLLEMNFPVSFPGWKDPAYVNERMKAAHVLLFTSRLEGMPNVLIEALAAGMVPVARNISSGVRDLLLNGYNAIVIDNENPGDYVLAIIRLFRDRNLLEKLAGNGHEKISRFEPIRQAAAYEKIILTAATDDNAEVIMFPAYKKGRLLDVKWLPNALVKIARKMYSNPKL